MATELTENQAASNIAVQNGDVANREIHEQLGRKYSAGFVTAIESESLPPGLDEDVVRAISARKNEPEWMTQWRLAAYRHWLTMTAPHWAKLQIAE
jgi:Fe-S cluster assembly protein SufB